jgi:hypothetical protein
VRASCALLTALLKRAGKYFVAYGSRQDTTNYGRRSALAASAKTAFKINMEVLAFREKGEHARSDHAECEHRLRDASEACDVRADDVVTATAKLLGSFGAIAMDVLHDLVQLVLGELEAPGIAAR